MSTALWPGPGPQQRISLDTGAASLHALRRQVERVEDLFRSEIDHSVMHSATRKRTPSSFDHTKPNAQRITQSACISFLCLAGPPHHVFAGTAPLFANGLKAVLLLHFLSSFSAIPFSVPFALSRFLPGAVVFLYAWCWSSLISLILVLPRALSSPQSIHHEVRDFASAWPSSQRR
ncbi:hypothetical protein IWZ00DRAFT_120892 [Phyllosticta capitalensis]